MSRAGILPAQLSTQFSPWSTDSATRESSANTVDFELFLVSLNSKAMCHLLGKTSKQVPFFTAGLKLSRCLKDWGSESHFPRYPRAQIRVNEWFSLWLFFVCAYVNVMRVYACMCACMCVMCACVSVFGCRCAHVMVHVWKSEDNSVELVLSFHSYMSSRNGTCEVSSFIPWVVSLARVCLLEDCCSFCQVHKLPGILLPPSPTSP